MRQAGPLVTVGPELVRTAVTEGAAHPHQRGRFGQLGALVQRDDPGDAAHQRAPFGANDWGTGGAISIIVVQDTPGPARRPDWCAEEQETFRRACGRPA